VYRIQGGDGVQVPPPRVHPLACFMAQQPPLGHGLLVGEASRPHSDKQQWVGLWTSYQPVPETRPLLDNTQHSQETDIHAAGRNRACNSSKREAADPRLRPRGHWDRPMPCINHARTFVTIEVYHVAINTNIPENQMARRLQTFQWKYTEGGTQYFPWSHYCSRNKY
jgi:hypothetical protein